MKLQTLAKAVLFVAIAATTFSSCNKEPETGDLTLQFDYKWAMSGADFELNTPLYQPMSGDTLTYSTFKHYVSNVRLMDADSNWWSEEESYHLLDFSDPTSLSFDLTGVPAGSYHAVEFMLGVDSARNVAGAQVGALDPANNMFWSWSTGYIFAKAEGTSPTLGGGMFMYHLGGFEAPNIAYSTRQLAFNQDVNLGPENMATIQVLANPARFFHTYGSVDNGAIIMMPGEDATTMANDFNSWVRLGLIVN